VWSRDSGACLTGLFADDRVTSFDGYSSGSGWINQYVRRVRASITTKPTLVAELDVVAVVKSDSRQSSD
jgi:hypothetical protein